MWACDSKISECDDFMLRTNLERLELLFAQQRCFEYFLPLSLDGHLKLADCPHPWHCAICDSSDHYQILCAPQRAYQEYLWTGGPAVTYSAALTGRIVVVDEDISSTSPLNGKALDYGSKHLVFKYRGKLIVFFIMYL
ncbi:hypothetical protein OUZ56_011937 [Daphnia magna]|uniref:Uncharacterized protein n=1 Tax=Daphnia magna TaxID=35525 RepID=A0ABQ9Z1L1_9CRUS|nr:hypothetical protein OUZ56_011937 [Daphnia magna]